MAMAMVSWTSCSSTVMDCPSSSSSAHSGNCSSWTDGLWRDINLAERRVHLIPSWRNLSQLRTSNHLKRNKLAHVMSAHNGIYGLGTNTSVASFSSQLALKPRVPLKHRDAIMELSVCYQPYNCVAHNRRVHLIPSWRNLSQLRTSNHLKRNKLAHVVSAHNGIYGLGTNTSVASFSSQLALKPRWNLGTPNAAGSFDRGNGVATMEGNNEHAHISVDQSIKLQNLNYEKKTDGVKEGLESAGHLWQESDMAERAEELGDFLDQLKEFQMKMESMIEQGDKETVSTLVKANHKSLLEQLDQGKKGLEQAAMLEILVQLSMSLQDFEAIRQMLDQMRDILVNMEVHEPFLDAFLEHMGSVYLVLGNKQEALYCYKRSLDIQESFVGKNSPQLVGTLLGLAGAYTEPEERDKGKAIYNQIVYILESSNGIACEELETPLLHLGYIFLEEKKPDEAEQCIRRALNIAENNNGKGGRIGVATCGLARVKYVKGDYEKAAELYRNGLSMLKNSGYWSNGDLALENIRMEAAEFFSIVGRTREAQDLWEEVLYEKEKLVGVNSPRLVVHLQNLATSYAQDGRFDRCEPLLRRSLKLVTASMGPTAPQVSIPLEFLATTLHHLEQNKEAESLARQALSIRERNFPEDHLLIGEACNILASILHANSKNKEALKLAWRALHIKEKHLGKNSKELAWTLDLLLELMDVLGETEEALPLMDRLEGLLDKSDKMAP